MQLTDGWIGWVYATGTLAMALGLFGVGGGSSDAIAAAGGVVVLLAGCLHLARRWRTAS